MRQVHCNDFKSRVRIVRNKKLDALLDKAKKIDVRRKSYHAPIFKKVTSPFLRRKSVHFDANPTVFEPLIYDGSSESELENTIQNEMENEQAPNINQADQMLINALPDPKPLPDAQLVPSLTNVMDLPIPNLRQVPLSPLRVNNEQPLDLTVRKKLPDLIPLKNVQALKQRDSFALNFSGKTYVRHRRRQSNATQFVIDSISKIEKDQLVARKQMKESVGTSETLNVVMNNPFDQFLLSDGFDANFGNLSYE